MAEKEPKFNKNLFSLIDQLCFVTISDDIIEGLSQGGGLLYNFRENIESIEINVSALSEFEREISEYLQRQNAALTPKHNKFWSLFVKRRISSRKLIAVLHIALLKGERSTATAAANCFLDLLQISGSNVYNIFNPFIFHEVLEMLRKQVVLFSPKSQSMSSHSHL
jgi:hypothetical protein